MSRLLDNLETTRLAASDAAPVAKGLLGMGIGAGVLGAVALALRYTIRPPTKERIPETLTPERFTVKSFQSSRGQTIYHEGGTPGTEPTLVFVHNVGVGASSYDWSKVYPAFAGRHRILAPDLLGFGESERPKVKLTATDYAAALAEFVEALCADEAQRPVIVARGQGAGFAALMAALHPEAASRLLLWMPSGRPQVPTWLNLASRVPTLNSYIYRNNLARRVTIRKRFEARGAFVDPKAVTQEMIEVHAICAQQYQADYAIFRLMQGKLSFDLEERWRDLKVPVTLLVPSLLAERLAGQTARLQAANQLCMPRVVEGVGPFAPLEAPQTVIDVLCAELRSEAGALKAG